MISKRSAKAYCRDDISLIENYVKAVSDTTQLWHCHHRRETILSRKDLIEIGAYYNRPACELIFLTPNEHLSLHKTGNANMLGKHHSAEARKRISEALKGEKCYIFGKHLPAETRKKLSESLSGEKNPLFGKHHSEESRQKNSLAHIGKHHSVETRRKMSEVHKGKHHSEETRLKMSAALKGKNHSAEARKKMSEARKGKHWYNNGDASILAKTCPEGFVPGRLK